MMNELGNWLLRTYFENPSIKWSMIIFGIFLLFFSLYNMSVTHTRARNGRMERHVRMPLKTPFKYKFRLPRITRTMSKPEKVFLHALCNFLLILLGVVLFIAGLILCTVAYQSFAENPTVLGRIWQIVLFLVGVGFVTGGFLTAWWRDKSNPFVPTN